MPSQKEIDALVAAAQGVWRAYGKHIAPKHPAQRGADIVGPMDDEMFALWQALQPLKSSTTSPPVPRSCG